jgi:hypothetical protein
MTELAHRSRRRSMLAWLVLAAGAAPIVPAASGAEPVKESAAVTHLAPRTVAERGRTRVIAFAVEPVSGADRALTTTVADPGVLELVRPGAVGAGAAVGYAQVRGLAVGTTDLVIGGATLPVRVVEPRTAASAETPAPTIVGPVAGARIWGTVAVGVELREPRHEPLRRVALKAGAMTLSPHTDTERRQEPLRQVTFRLDASGLEPGPLALVPIAVDAEGREQAGRPVSVVVIAPNAERLVAGEAEGRYEVERPDRFRDARLTIGRDRDASGGAYFSNAAGQPAVCFPLTVDAPGWYQVALTASGTRAQGALPTVGIVVDGSNVSRTNVRLLETGWHRVAAGVPFRLESGTHVVTPYFANDFYVPSRADRNLRLDRFEVVRLEGDGMGGGGGGGGGMMMAGALDEAAMAEGMVGAMAGGMAGGGDGLGRRLVDDPHGTDAPPVRIGFVRPLDGQTIPGLLEVEGRCWWDGLERAPAPLVTLLVNDVPVDEQRSGAPRFWVDPGHFQPGANRIQMTARLPGGAETRTPVQTMRWPEEAAPAEPRPPRRHPRFSIHDERWSPVVRERLRTDHYPKERRSAAFHAEATATLDLPPGLVGSYIVFLETRGDHFEGAPIAAVTLRAGDEETPIGEVAARGWWSPMRVGDVELEPGPKQLAVAFTNDRYERGGGDRNLWFQAVMLAKKPDETDRTAPVVTIAWPPDDHPAHDVDALVAEASDDASLSAAELIVDGMPTGYTVAMNLRPGRIVLPLLLRDLEPGPHTVAVRVQDVTGNSTQSEPRTIIVSADAPPERGPYARAVHLLNRFAYGPDPHELAAILTMGETAWLADRLARPLDDAGDLAALGAGYPYFVDSGPYATSRRVLSHLLLTPNPVRARFVLWTENHFSTWIRKTQGERKWREHVAFSRLGVAPFDHLLLASAESPAMLAYLDQERSYVGRLNENYAREVMELHTLGVDGGYTQEDVTNLAGLLTGWTASVEGDGRGGGPAAIRYTFRYSPRLNDGSGTVLLGLPLPAADRGARYDRTRFALEMLAAHPSTARFISRKLAEHYVSAPAPDDLVDDLAARFLETGGDMRALVLDLAAHPAFWRGDEPGRVTSAMDYAIRLCRVTGHYQPWQVGDYLQRSGRGMFDRPSPDGYPEEDAASADSNAMIQRWRLALQTEWPLSSLVPGPWQQAAGLSDPEWAQRAVDTIAVRLTGRTLGPASNEAAVTFATTADEDGLAPRGQRIRRIGPLVAQLPEANLR